MTCYRVSQLNSSKQNVAFQFLKGTDSSLYKTGGGDKVSDWESVRECMCVWANVCVFGVCLCVWGGLKYYEMVHNHNFIPRRATSSDCDTPHGNRGSGVKVDFEEKKNEFHFPLSFA